MGIAKCCCVRWPVCNFLLSWLCERNRYLQQFYQHEAEWRTRGLSHCAADDTQIRNRTCLNIYRRVLTPGPTTPISFVGRLEKGTGWDAFLSAMDRAVAAAVSKYADGRLRRYRAAADAFFGSSCICFRRWLRSALCLLPAAPRISGWPWVHNFSHLALFALSFLSCSHHALVTVFACSTVRLAIPLALARFVWDRCTSNPQSCPGRTRRPDNSHHASQRHAEERR